MTFAVACRVRICLNRDYLAELFAIPKLFRPLILCWGCLALCQSSPAQQANDLAYSKEVHDYTTQPYFLTELVDHLPASSRIPTPQKILGYVVGAPGHLTYSGDIYRFYRALEKASPRVKVFEAGTTEEGRQFLTVVVSDEANISRLEELREITARLADPRKLSSLQGERLTREGKPFYWVTGSIHSPETGAPEMLMELAYRLAAEESAVIQNIRKNVVLLITPLVEVDGHDRMVDLWNYEKSNPGRPFPDLIFWGHYVSHDNNRDGIAMALKLSQSIMRSFLYWHPQVLHDLHESIPYLYTSTGTGPYNPWFDPIVIDEWEQLASYEVEQFTQRGVPGVWTHGFFDGWAPNYMFSVANTHNAIGRFYETYGNGDPGTRRRSLSPSETSRQWYRPNPPYPSIEWSLRDNINLEESGIIFALDYTATHAQGFMQRFYLKSNRAVNKAHAEGPVAWAIVNDETRRTLSADLANLLRKQGVEVWRLDQSIEIEQSAGRKDDKAESPGKGADLRTKLSEGSFIIRMDQPYSRVADMLLDTQYYAPTEQESYDDTGWSLGPLFNVVTVRITDPTILKARMTLLDGPIKVIKTGIETYRDRTPTSTFIVNAEAEPAFASLRFRFPKARFFAAETPFELDGRKYNAGTYLIPKNGNPDDLEQSLNQAAGEFGLRVAVGSTVPRVAQHEVGFPRIALAHTWLDTQSDGWFRLAFDTSGVPYNYISTTVLQKTEKLREHYDVIVFPPVPYNLSFLITGFPSRKLPNGLNLEPIPWHVSSSTPNFGGVDETSDIRGGLGFEGLSHLKEFVEDGGLLIVAGSSSRLATDLGFADTVNVVETKSLRARGTIVRGRVEGGLSPITYGYGDAVPVYFNQGPVFRVSLTLGLWFYDNADDSPRSSGRGSVTDPDIPQGRLFEPPELRPHRNPVEKETYIDPELKRYARGFIPPQSLWPRVVVRFASKDDLWISGQLAGGEELADTPCVIDVPSGKGHVVLLANNPMWRQETRGSLMLVLNAALHFDHLSVGAAEIDHRAGKNDDVSTKDSRTTPN